MNQYNFMILVLLAVMISCSSGDSCFINGKWKSYNKSTQICCTSPYANILDIQAGDDPNDYLCCEGIARKKSVYHCCDNLAIAKEPINKNKQCCGKVLFEHGQHQFCCNGTLHQKFIEDTTKKERECCLSTETFIIGQERCTPNGVLPFDKEYCGKEIYDINSKMCCSGVVCDRPSDIKTENYCCGNQSYSTLHGKCCHDEETGRDNVIGKAYECCGSGKILTATQFCCNGFGYNRSSDLQCCGDVGVFNKNHEKCCRSGSRYSLGAIPNAEDHGKCCGNGDKLQAYDDREHRCCGGIRPGEPGGVITLKKKTLDNHCCYNATSKTFTTINNKEEYCPGRGPHGYENGPKEICGSAMIYTWTHTCCHGIAALNIKDTNTGKCCRNKLYDPNTHNCCYGEIIKKTEWQCCKIPKDKRKLTEKCDEVQTCGRKAINPKTRMCCDSFDHPKQDRSGKNYSCCGRERVLTMNYDAQCCAGQKIDSSKKCCSGKPISKDERCIEGGLPKMRSTTSRITGYGNDADCNPSKTKHSFPPHAVSDTCSGRSYDMTKQWCLNGRIVPVKNIMPGSCCTLSSSSQQIVKKLVQRQPLKKYILVIMTTASHPEELHTSLGGRVLYRRARVVEDLTRVHRRRQLGKRINLLIPLHGRNQCRDMLKERYRRFILVTSQEPWRGMLMFEANDVIFKYESRFVKQMEKILYA